MSFSFRYPFEYIVELGDDGLWRVWSGDSVEYPGSLCFCVEPWSQLGFRTGEIAMEEVEKRVPGKRVLFVPKPVDCWDILSAGGLEMTDSG